MDMDNKEPTKEEVEDDQYLPKSILAKDLPQEIIDAMNEQLKRYSDSEDDSD